VHVYAADEHDGRRFASVLEAAMVGINVGDQRRGHLQRRRPVRRRQKLRPKTGGGTEGIGEYLSLPSLHRDTAKLHSVTGVT
jgi:hypothetical protein